MTLILIRHGKALDRDQFALECLNDDLRPLIKAGRQETEMICETLKKLNFNVQIIAMSPLTRSRQTAEIISEQFKNAKCLLLKELSPQGSFIELVKRIKKRTENEIVLVGHEPDIGQFISYLVAGAKNSNFQLKKSGLAIVKFEEPINPGKGRLLCFIQPSQIRKILKK